MTDHLNCKDRSFSIISRLWIHIHGPLHIEINPNFNLRELKKMNSTIKELVFNFDPCDPKVTRPQLEEAVKSLQRALSIKHPVDGVFKCPIPDCTKGYPQKENLRNGSINE